VHYEWSPEPTPEEREALERALAEALDDQAELRSAWWQAGLREALSSEPELVRLKHEPGGEALPAEEP
jgi:hypothetical protein